MSKLAIDLDRGVMIKRHTASGVYVYMYMDEPGVYLNAFGKTVPESMAKLVGYDVVNLGKKRLRKERMAAAMTAIDAELNGVEEDENYEALNIIKEGGGFKVIAMPLGNAKVIDENGGEMTPRPIPQAEAIVLFEHLVPENEVPAQAVGKKKGA